MTLQENIYEVNHIEKRVFGLISALLASGMLLAACGNTAASSTASSSHPTAQTTAVRPQDDFYAAVNQEWIDSAVIPASQPASGGFYDLQTDVTETLMADIDTLLQDDRSQLSKEMQDFLTFYELTADYERRNTEGAEPIMADLSEIESLTSLKDLNDKFVDFALKGYALPFSFYVSTDMGNADHNALYASMPSLFLYDKSYYAEGDPTGEMLVQTNTQMFTTLLTMAGKTEDEAASITQQAMEFDALLAGYAKSAEESSNFAAMYNPQPFAEFTAQSSQFDLNGIITKLTGTTPEQVIVSNVEYYAALDEIITAENFENIKSWMYINLLYHSCGSLSEDFETTGSTVSMMMNGQTELSPAQERAYNYASGIYAPTVGIYYGQTYFGEEAKEDVTNMVNNFIDVYKSRLEATDWLTQETRDAAILKLDNLSVQIGYPESIPEIYSQITVDPDKSLYANTQEMTILTLADNYGSLDRPVDRSQWSVGGHVVNAYYSPMTNTITFPAGILQAPFYSLEQSPSENYGGIGAVIAHEISHAFDPNGAMFDEKGNMSNWWTEQDYTEFETRTNAVAEQFDGMEYAGGTVNGALTVTENTADAGGLSVALEVLKNQDDANLEEFFTNWAVIWRMKSTPEYDQMLLTMDVHAPNKLRANVQLSNLDDFYTTFDVKEGDGMYIAPEDRVAVW